MLTEKMVATAETRPKAYKIADGRGLYVMVYPSGVKALRWKYRYAGREKLLTFGKHPLTTLREARDRADDARRMLRNGFDPASPAIASRDEYLDRLSRLAVPDGGSNKIYFIQTVSGHIKIGVTSNVAGRLSLMQWANPERLELLAVMPGGKSHETVLHQMFAAERAEGEWFTSSVDLAAFISSLPKDVRC